MRESEFMWPLGLLETFVLTYGLFLSPSIYTFVFLFISVFNVQAKIF